MEKKNLLTKVLAVVGTALTWLPLLAPVLFSLIGIFARRVFHFDYLMPAELFFLALSGGALLVWAAMRVRAAQPALAHLPLIGGGLGAALVLLMGGQALAVATGLASGETEPGGWQMALVIAALVIYDVALVGVGIGGILLLRDLFQTPRSLVK